MSDFSEKSDIFNRKRGSVGLILANKQNIIAATIIILLILTGCGVDATVQPTNPVVAAQPSVTPSVTPSLTPRPTSTPTPLPTATATATPTPLPTPTIVVTITPRAAGTQEIQLAPISLTATTQLSPTAEFTITEVPPPVEPIALPEGTINIALLGIDTRPTRGFANTDVIIIASIRPDVPAVTMLSIPRDLLVYIPDWRSHKVNTAFAKGGFELFRQTILYNLGISLDYYAMVNFNAVVNSVNTLDGVDIVATCPLYQVFPADPYYMGDPTTPLTVTQVYTNFFTGEVWQPGIAVPTQTINIPWPGVYKLDGLQALAYVRARYGVPGGDIDRGRREQRLVRALISKAIQINAIPRIPQLFTDFRKDVKTDLAIDNILYFAGMAGRMDEMVFQSRFLDPQSIKFMLLPEVGSVIVMDREKMRPYLEEALVVALNQRPNDGIPIDVWNGTGDAGYGIAAADRLSELGFVVKDIRPADAYYPKSLIMDFTTTRKGSAIPLLLRTFKLKAEQVVPLPNADGPRYRIVVGADFDPCYYRNGTLAPPATPTPAPTATP